MRRFIIFIAFVLSFYNYIYPNVSIKGYVDKKSIFYFQDIVYTIEIVGAYQTFSFDGINESDINDFDVIDKKIESTVIHSSEYKELVLNKKIIYTIKPISKGTLRIPALDIKYFAIDENKVLSERTISLESILVHVYGNAFLIFSIVAIVVLIIVFIFFILIFSRKYIKIKNK